MRTVVFLRQLYRSSHRTLLNILLLNIVSAFFVMSLNLYQNSIQNIQTAEDTYSTIAVTELYADVDKYGNLISAGGDGYAGYLPTAVREYDLTGIVTSEYVEAWDLRSRYGAYVPGHISKNRGGKYPLFENDLVRFVINGDTPVTVPVTAEGPLQEVKSVSVTVLDDAAGLYTYREKLSIGIRAAKEEQTRYAKELLLLDGEQQDGLFQTITLYPGVEYLVCNLPAPWNWPTLEDGKQSSNMIGAYADEYGWELWVEYRDNATDVQRAQYTEEQPFWLYRWEDVQNDSVLKAYFEQAWQAYEYSAHSFVVTTANDGLGVTAFHLGAAYLHEGRLITEEEYETGAKVCMVSDVQAANQGWKLGDKLELNLYDYDTFPNQSVNWEGMSASYTQNTKGIFHTGEYEIVGIFSQREMIGTSTVSESAVTMPWNSVYIPEKSVQNAPDTENPLIHGSLLTIWLKNGTINDFLEEMSAKGVTTAKDDGYAAQFTFYDQGYSAVQPSLEAMSGTASMLLALSVALLVACIVLLAWMFAQNQKHNVGILRMLGGSKMKATLSVLLCAAVLAGCGMITGACLGHALTETVGQVVLREKPEESPVETVFRAYLVSDQDIAMELSTGATVDLTLLAFSGACLAFLTLVLLFVLAYLYKEPRELLPGNKN